MSAESAWRVTASADVSVVSLAGELDLATARGLVDWIVDQSGPTVVVDLAELTFMDSAGISAMVQVKRKLGDSFTLTRPQPNVRRVLELTGLGSWISDWNPEWSDAAV